MDAVAAAGLGVVLILILLLLRWRVRASLKLTPKNLQPEPTVPSDMLLCHQPGNLVHRLCPHNNVVQGFDLEQKDSLDDHLDVLARKLAEKESRLRLSKSKIRETQNEIQNLHAIDHNVRLRYREIMDSLRTDLMSNEKECRKLQEQIEWVSRRRAELKEEASVAAIAGLEYEAASALGDQERRALRHDWTPQRHSELAVEKLVRRGQRLYGEAAAELASNLAELQRGRTLEKITEKPSMPPSVTSPRHRKEPHLPQAMPMSSLVIKSSPADITAMERNTQLGYHHSPM